jgi:2-polyprenyl-3-methyl-5-hydroxy-6-metoxy-1,4-benzoquinol methylase
MEIEKINLEKERWNMGYRNGMSYGQIQNPKILEIINNLNNKEAKVLDLGCGAGQLSSYINKADYDVTGMDISDVGIEKAKASFGGDDEEGVGKNLEFLVGDIFDVKEKYDVIVCKLVYAFIIDKKEFLEKLKSILNEGGIFIISTPVITLENKEKVLKPGICITKEDIENLKNYFSSVDAKLESQDDFGDNYVITCQR